MIYNENGLNYQSKTPAASSFTQHHAHREKRAVPHHAALRCAGERGRGEEEKKLRQQAAPRGTTHTERSEPCSTAPRSTTKRREEKKEEREGEKNQKSYLLSVGAGKKVPYPK